VGRVGQREADSEEPAAVQCEGRTSRGGEDKKRNKEDGGPKEGRSGAKKKAPLREKGWGRTKENTTKDGSARCASGRTWRDKGRECAIGDVFGGGGQRGKAGGPTESGTVQAVGTEVPGQYKQVGPGKRLVGGPWQNRVSEQGQKKQKGEATTRPVR